MKFFMWIVVVLCVMSCIAPAARSDAKEPAASVIETVIIDAGIEAAWAEFEKMRADSAAYSVVEAEFNALGYRLIRQAHIKEAVAVLKMAAEAFPDAWNVWDSLGDAYCYDGDKERAVASYTRSLELNPENENATWALQQVDGRIYARSHETPEARRHSPGEQTGLKGPYFGQTPPGKTPEVFAPGIVSCRGDLEYAITFTPDGKECYYSSHTGLRTSRLEEDGWTAPRHAPFTEQYPRAFEPHITPDGTLMYFGNGMDIWVMDRMPNGSWNNGRLHGPGMFATTTADGVLYVTDISGGGFGYIVRQKLVDGQYGAPERAGGGVADTTGSAHPCIAPDESFIVFDSFRVGAIGEDDLYVCFRGDDDSWGGAVPLPATVNTLGADFCATLSPDGKYLFYTAKNDIYWVSAEILDDLK